MVNQAIMKKKYINTILTLLAVAVMPIYLYGTRVIPLYIAGVVTAIVVEFLCIRLAGKKKIEKNDYSAIITALIITLLLPATAPVWIVVVAVVIALAIAKHPFGGTGNNIFNPAAVGLAFVAICWPEYALRYPIPQVIKTVTDDSLIPYTNSFSSILKGGGTPKIQYFQVLLGDFAGPMGATCILVLITCLFYLLFRRIIHTRIAFSTLAVVVISAILFPRVQTSLFSSVFFELTSGVLLFGVIFLANDPATMPKTKSGQILYGVILGIFLMIFRHYGEMELEFVFALLIANIFAIPCDRYAYAMQRKFNKVIDESKNAIKKIESAEEDGLEVKELTGSTQTRVKNPRIVVVGEVTSEEEKKTVAATESFANETNSKPVTKNDVAGKENNKTTELQNKKQPAKKNFNQARKKNSKGGKAGKRK